MIRRSSMEYRVFLSSSSEQLDVAKALEANLTTEGFEVTLWSRDAHQASQYNLDALLARTTAVDFAVFLFVPDDQATVHGEQVSLVRDNVVFEAGLFMGALGRDRCFIVRAADAPMHVPTDLTGFTMLTFDPRRSDNSLSRSLHAISRERFDQASWQYGSGGNPTGHFIGGNGSTVMMPRLADQRLGRHVMAHGKR
jgi:predicted nucleotide-binding protein